MDSPNEQVDETTTPDSTSETEISPDDAEETGSEGDEASRKRGAEARINELIARNAKLEEKLDYVAQRVAPPPPPVSETEINPDVQKAKDYLRTNLDVATREDLQAMRKQIQEDAELQNEHRRLESIYDGSDGRPKYDRSGVEDYARKNAVYNPEVAYRDLHRVELFDWELKKLDEKKKQQPYVEKSGSTLNRSDNTITREKIAEWMKTPEGRAKYEQNRDKILKLMQQGQL